DSPIEDSRKLPHLRCRINIGLANCAPRDRIRYARIRQLPCDFHPFAAEHELRGLTQHTCRGDVSRRCLQKTSAARGIKTPTVPRRAGCFSQSPRSGSSRDEIASGSSPHRKEDTLGHWSRLLRRSHRKGARSSHRLATTRSCAFEGGNRI